METKAEVERELKKTKEAIGGIDPIDQENIDKGAQILLQGIEVAVGTGIRRDQCTGLFEDTLKTTLETLYCAGAARGFERGRETINIKVPECPECGWIFK